MNIYELVVDENGLVKIIEVLKDDYRFIGIEPNGSSGIIFYTLKYQPKFA